MVIGELGGLHPGNDQSAHAGHDQAGEAQASKTLLEHVADGPPQAMTLQEYKTEQQSLAGEANQLRGVLNTSPAQFAKDVTPFLQREIALGNTARASQNQPAPSDLLGNFAVQAQTGEAAQNMMNTLKTMGAGALNDPGVRFSVDMYLQQIAGPTLGGR